MRNRSPEYRAEYTRIRREFNAQKEAEAQAAADKAHQAQIEQAIRDCVLRPEEQSKVDERARELAQSDLAAGKIAYSQMGAAVERYASLLTEEAKTNKVVKRARTPCRAVSGRNRGAGECSPALALFAE